MYFVQGGRESASRGIRVDRRKMTGNSDMPVERAEQLATGLFAPGRSRGERAFGVPVAHGLGVSEVVCAYAQTVFIGLIVGIQHAAGGGAGGRGGRGPL